MKRNNFIQIYSKIYEIYDLFTFSLNYILIKSLIEDTDNIMHITVDKLIDIFLTLKRKNIYIHFNKQYVITQDIGIPNIGKISTQPDIIM